jgi:para-aminobenzoate synthetase component 1
VAGPGEPATTGGITFANTTGLRPIIVERCPTQASPAALFDRLPAGPGRFLLESAGGPRDIAGWSFLGFRPYLTITARGTLVEISGPDGTDRRQMNPFDAVDAVLSRYAVERDQELPPFCGGLVGYFAYDAGRCLERMPATATDDLALPDVYLHAYDAAVAFDHVRGEALVVVLPIPGREAAALATAHTLAALVREAPPALPPLQPVTHRLAITSNFEQDVYLQAVARAIDYIGAGDIFQVNLAQRFTTALPFSPWELYRRLRAINPAPFAAFLDGGDFQVVSASPERFLHVRPVPGTRQSRVETRPIKGTRPRGATPAADDAQRHALRASPKERAELTMIVDLMRNDIGRVCQFGTVQVPDLRRIEAYPTVFHTVATVEGLLNPGVTPGQLLKATFPGGSVTGAPKIRAMEIIEELEGLRRGVYCGALGYLAFSGTVDLNIVIRTLLCRNGNAYFHAGGGIVADSEPAAEYEETLCKARALIDALLGRV